ncbi:MAG: aminodeoxychorismate synthase component 1 [Enterobacteriaceae bacterium]
MSQSKLARPATQLLPYTRNALSEWFAPIAHLPWAMMLHSGDAQHQHSRFDILVADPVATLLTRGDTTEIRTGTEYRHSQDDPLALLQQRLSQHLPQIDRDESLPFQGGAVGSFSYDLGRRFEHLPTLAQQDIDYPEMAVGIYDWALIADHQQRTLTLLSHGDLKQRKAWLEQQSHRQSPAEPASLLAPWRSTIDYPEYCRQFNAIQDYLHAGDCYEINLTQRFQAPYQGDEWALFTELNRANKAPFSAFLRLPEQAVLSISPERFIRLHNGNIETRPIKGTAPRGQNPQEDQALASQLRASPKAQAENLMIVDLMRNDVGQVAEVGTVQVTELFAIESFPAVHQMVSTITARLLADKSPADLLRACFPGGSITGAPKIRAMEIIEELEPQRRSVYCGSIGYISCCATMDLNIAIRTVLASEGMLYCWAGGAIVADSQVAEEYQEIQDKLARILPLLGEFNRESLA